MKDMIKYILLCLVVLTGSTACSDFVEGYDKSPNSPTEVTPALLLSSAELGLQTSYTSGIDRISSILVQQIAGTKDQMLEVATYSLREGDNVNEWNTIYNNIVQTTNDLINKTNSSSPYYAGIAKVIKAMGIALATDAWGDVPASEAGMGLITGNKTPKFETQSEVYVYILNLLKEADTDLAKSSDDNVYLPGSDDFLYQGDIEKWKNLIVWLQARYENHLSKKNATTSATKVLALLGSTVIAEPSTDFNLYAVYGSKGSELNQWYAFENSRADYIKAGEFMVNLLKAKNDPRLSFYFSKNEGGNYVGSPVSSTDLTASTLGSYIVSQTAPIPIVTYSEVLFIQAEAALRNNNKELAAKAYNAAVSSSIKLVTGLAPDNQYIAVEASETASTITLKKIIEQKYLALFVNVEAWNDWKRTGYPQLIANSGGSVAAIPQRLPTVMDERKYNPNAIVVSDILKPVWWAE